MILRVDARSATAQENTFHAVTRPRMVAELVVAFTDPGSFWYSGAAASLLLDGETCSVIEHQQDQLMYQQEVIDEAGAARIPVHQYAQEHTGKPVDLRVGKKPETFAGEPHEWKGCSFKMRQHIAAVDEELYLELVNVEANPLGELFLSGMSDVRKKRTKQLAFMLMMHTKTRAIQMITGLSDPVNGLEIWRRFLEVWEPVNRGRNRAMLMQLLQRPLMGSRGQALEECECPVRQYEAQNVDMLRNTGTPTGFRVVQMCQIERDETAGVRCTQKYLERKAKASAKAKRKASAMAKKKEKARISRRTEHQTRRTRNAPSARERIVPSL